MKILNVIAIALSVLLIGLSFYYIDEVFFLRWVNYVDYNPSNKLKAELLTFYIGLFSFVFFIPFLILFIKQLRLRKVLALIGIVLSTVMIVWDLMMITSPSHISFDEVGLAWMAYGICSAVLFVLFLLKSKEQTNSEVDDIIDDVEF